MTQTNSLFVSKSRKVNSNNFPQNPESFFFSISQDLREQNSKSLLIKLKFKSCTKEEIEKVLNPKKRNSNDNAWNRMKKACRDSFNTNNVSKWYDVIYHIIRSIRYFKYGKQHDQAYL